MHKRRSAAGQPLPSRRGQRLITAGLLQFAAVRRLVESLGQGPHVVPYGPASSGSGHGTADSFPCSVPKWGEGGRGDLPAARVVERFFFFRQEYLNIDFFFKAYKMGCFLVLEFLALSITHGGNVSPHFASDSPSITLSPDMCQPCLCPRLLHAG